MNKKTYYFSICGLVCLLMLGIGIIVYGISIYEEIEISNEPKTNENYTIIYTNQSPPKQFFTIPITLQVNVS